MTACPELHTKESLQVAEAAVVSSRVDLLQDRAALCVAEVRGQCGVAIGAVLEAAVVEIAERAAA